MKEKKFSLGDIRHKLSQEPDSPRQPPESSPDPSRVQPPGNSSQSQEPPRTKDEPLPLQPAPPSRPQMPPPSARRHSSGGHLDSQDEELVDFDLFRYLAIILQRKNIVLLVTLLVTLASVFQFIRGDKLYVSHARLLFKPEGQEIISDQGFRFTGMDRDKAFNTHLELLKSNTVLTMVAENLDGKISYEDISRGLRIEQGITNREKNDIIELYFECPKAALSQDVLNELCRTYIDYRLQVNSQEVTRLLYRFESQINKVQDELDRKESDLRRFKEDNRMVKLSDETNLTVSKLSSMELDLQQTQLALIESKQKLSSLNNQIDRQDLDIVQSITLTDPMRDRIAALEMEYNSLSAEYSDEHFKVKMIRQQIEKLKEVTADSLTREASERTMVKNPIRQALMQSYINLTIDRSALESKRIALEQLIQRLNNDLVKLPSMEQQYAFLQRETESILQTLKLLKSKYEETKIRRDSQDTDIKILELARLPLTATSAVNPSIIFIGLIIGLLLGIALALLLDYLDQSVKVPTDVEKNLDLPLLGIVPLIEADKGIIQQTKDQTKNILEPFRSLRANLKHLAAAHQSKTFMLCSAVKGEGKTTLSANLAVTFALDGKKVILIDADLRRSQVHSLFSIPKEIGLSDYLIATKEVDEILKPTTYENLLIITSGERPHNPAELLGTCRLDTLIKELKDRADVVLFDSPALLPVSDGLTLAPKMDGCLMVVRSRWTPTKAAKQSRSQLERIGTHLLGVIFNGMSQSRGYYPYYYGYYGYYSYSKYTYEDESSRKFSWREAGLQMESRIKATASNLGNSIPKHIGRTSGFIRHLSAKKTFWILFLTLLMLTGIELWLRLTPPRQTAIQDGITYLGMGGGDSLRHDSPRESGETEDRSNLPDALRNNIMLWFNAHKAGNADASFLLYDSLAFGAQEGGFSAWKSNERQRIENNAIETTLILNGIQPLAHAPDSITTSASITAVSGNDTSHLLVTQSWKNHNMNWRIVQEKTLETAK